MPNSDIAATAAILASIAALCTVLGFWTRFSDRISKAQSDAKNALQEGAEAKVEIEKVRVAIAAVGGQVSLFREQVAREYPDKDALREVEERIISTIKESAADTKDQLGEMSRRIDNLADQRHRRET